MFFDSLRKKKENELQNYIKEECGIEIYKEQISVAELKEKGYRKISADVIGHLNQIFQFAPQIAVDMINNNAVQKAFDMATKDTYRAILDSGTYLAKSKKTIGAVRGSELSIVTNQVAGQAEWMPNNAVLSVSNAPQVALGIFNVASLVTGQYFMAQINDKLSNMKEGIEHIDQFLKAEKRSELKAYLQTLEKIYNRIDFIKQSSEQRQATLIQLKMIQTETQALINLSQEEVNSVRKNIKIKDKEEIITENIKMIGNNVGNYYYSTLAYVIAVSLEVYLTDIVEDKYLNIMYEDMKSIIMQYKVDYLLCEEEMQNYLEMSNVLNKRSPVQVMTDVATAIGASVITGSSLAVKTAEFVDEAFNEKRAKRKQKELKSLEERMMNCGNTEELDASLEEIKNYISFTKSKIELVKIDEDFYVKYDIE